MARIRRRIVTLTLALLAAVSISLALPSSTFAEGGPEDAAASYPNSVNPKGSRCQCGWK